MRKLLAVGRVVKGKLTTLPEGILEWNPDSFTVVATEMTVVRQTGEVETIHFRTVKGP